MLKHTITIGLNDKDAEIQILSTETAAEIIAEILIENHGIFAYTMTECKGVYKMDSTGHIVKENSIRIEIADDGENDIIGAICDIKIRLNQESIMYERTENTDIQFI